MTNFNKLAKENPQALNPEGENNEQEYQNLKKECEDLAKEIKHLIILRPTQEMKEKADAIHINQKTVRKKIEEKYADLFAKLRRDYELESLYAMRTFMQQELRAYKGGGKVDFVVSK